MFFGFLLNLDVYSFFFIDINIGDVNEFKDFFFVMFVYIFGFMGCIFYFKFMILFDIIMDVSVCIDGIMLIMELLLDFGVFVFFYFVLLF